MKIYQWQVVKPFDPKKDYGQKIPPRIRGILSLLQKGQSLLSRDFIEKNKGKILPLLRVKNDISVQKAVEASFAVAVKIGILEKIKGPIDGRIPFEEFCKIPEVSYWLSQVRGSNIKTVSIKRNGADGTKSVYGYGLWNFHCWLSGKTFEFSQMIQFDEGKYELKKQKIKLDGVHHFLKLYQSPNSQRREFVKIIKTYLFDTGIHKDSNAKTVELKSCAIKSFFRENDSDIDYTFNAKSTYKGHDPEAEERSLSLDEFFQILTVGRPSITEKSVFLCKFHAGMDSSTLADRFNFQAFSQIADHFKSPDHNSWDLEKCPVPVILIRVKTGTKSIVFLDRDAIEALQKYLDYRQKKTGLAMKAGEPMFLTKHNLPIRTNWIDKQFNKLATNAGLQRKLKGKKYQNKIISHELRDLLKSTLIACGVRADVADNCISHKLKDSYEKQAFLYPENLKAEYSKASRKINLFSNYSRNIKSDDVLRDQLDALTNRLAKVEQEKRDERNGKERVKEIADCRMFKILELYQRAQKLGVPISISWDKTKPIHYPDGL